MGWGDGGGDGGKGLRHVGLDCLSESWSEMNDLLKNCIWYVWV